MTSHSWNIIVKSIWHLPRNLIVLAVRGYQATLSPDHGPLKQLHPYGYCRHSPTCSMYAINVLQRRGAVIGSLLAAKRVLSCNPWTKMDNEKILEVTKKIR